MTTYHIEKLTYAYKGAERPSNDGISLSIPQGEIVGLLGPNGAGKTTLIRQMLGLLKPTRGKILLYGTDIAVRPEIVAQYVAYLPQQGFGMALNSLRVEEVLVYFARICGISAKDAQIQAFHLMKRLNISSTAHSLIRDLSGGQKRLAALAAILAQKKPILILDEPTNDLDPESRRLVWKLLEELRQDRKTSIILITHNALEADQVVDRVALMEKGSIRVCESLSSLKARNKSLAVEFHCAVSPPQEFWDGLRSFGPPNQENHRVFSLRCEPERLSLLSEALGRGIPSGMTWSIRTRTLEDVYFEIKSSGEVFA